MSFLTIKRLLYVTNSNPIRAFNERYVFQKDIYKTITPAEFQLN